MPGFEPFDVTSYEVRYYLGTVGQATTTLRCAFTLDHEVDRDAMASALVRAAHTYPQMGARVRFEEGRLYYEPNTEPLVLHDAEDERCVFGSAALNHYQHRSWACGNEFGMHLNHGMGDGNLLMSFFKTLFYYYALERGEQIDEREASQVLREGDVKPPAFDPALRYGDLEHAQSHGSRDVGPLFSIPGPYLDEDGSKTHRRHFITMPYEQLHDLAKRTGTRVSPLIQALEARALMRVWDGEGKSFLGGIATNMRQYFDAGQVSNFSDGNAVILPASLAHADLAAQCAPLQKAMEAQFNTETFRPIIGARALEARSQLATPIEETFGPEAEQRRWQQNVAIRHMLSIMISNIGALRLVPSLEGMVRQARFSLPSFQCPYNLTMVSVGGTLTMGLSHFFETDGFCRELLAELRSHGIDAEGTDDGIHDAPRLTLESFA